MGKPWESRSNPLIDYVQHDPFAAEKTGENHWQNTTVVRQTPTFSARFQGRKNASASAKDKVIAKGDDNQKSASRTDNTVSRHVQQRTNLRELQKKDQTLEGFLLLYIIYVYIYTYTYIYIYIYYIY